MHLIKNIFVVISILICMCLVVPQAFASELAIEKIREASNSIKLCMRNKDAYRMAVTGIRTLSGDSNSLTVWLSDVLTSELAKNSQITVVERERLEQIVHENSLAFDDLFNENNAIKLGQFLNADIIINGTITMLSNDISLTLRVVNCNTGVVVSGCGFTGVIKKTPNLIILYSQSKSKLNQQIGKQKKHQKNEKINSLRSVPKYITESQVKNFIISHNIYDSRRNSEAQYTDNLIDNNDETITDLNTGLIWEKAGSERTFIYEDITVYINRLNGNNAYGFNDWRLPTLEELMSLIRADTVSELHISPLFSTKQRWCWTSDRYSSDAAWFVDFRLGHSTWFSISNDYYIRAVRTAYPK